MKKYLFIFALLVLTILVGAGCQKTEADLNTELKCLREDEKTETYLIISWYKAKEQTRFCKDVRDCELRDIIIYFFLKDGTVQKGEMLSSEVTWGDEDYQSLRIKTTSYWIERDSWDKAHCNTDEETKIYLNK